MSGPVTATLAWARPPDNVAAPIPGGRVWDAPACRSAWFAHRVELDGRLEPEAAFAIWDAHHAGKGVERRFVFAELPVDAPWPRIRPRWAPNALWGLARDGRVDAREPVLPIREVDDLEWFVRVAAGQLPRSGEGYRAFLAWLHAGLRTAGSVVLAAWDGAVPVASVTAVPGAGIWRFQEIWTDPAWRRRGLCDALVRAALRRDPSATFVLTALVDGPALRVYERLGFARVSKCVELSTESAG